MSLFAFALVIPALAPTSLPSDSLALSPLAEFLAPAPSLARAPESDAADAADSLLSYTYLEIGAAQNDVDDYSEDVDIVYGRASLNLLHFFYVFGEYSNQSTDFADTDNDQIALGVGAHIGLLPTLDLYGEVGALFSDVSSDNGDVDGSESGYRLAGGARWLVLPWISGGLELDAMLGTIDLDNRLGSDENPFFYGIGARAHFLKFLSVGAMYEQIEDDDAISANVRWSF